MSSTQLPFEEQVDRIAAELGVQFNTSLTTAGINTLANKLRNEDLPVVNVSMGEPGLAFPRTYLEFSEADWNLIHEYASGYNGFTAIPNVTEAVLAAVDKLHGATGTHVHPCAGAMSGLFTMGGYVKKHGGAKKVLRLKPGFNVVEAQQWGWGLQEIGIDSEDMTNLGTLIERAVKEYNPSIILITSPSNPTAQSIDQETLNRIAYATNRTKGDSIPLVVDTAYSGMDPREGVNQVSVFKTG